MQNKGVVGGLKLLAGVDGTVILMISEESNDWLGFRYILNGCVIADKDDKVKSWRYWKKLAKPFS